MVASFSFSPPHITRGKTATLKNRQREGKHPIETFSITKRGKQKAGSILPGKSLAVAEQSIQNNWINHKEIGNFGEIKSLKEVLPDERPDGCRTGDKSRDTRVDRME